MVIADVFLDLVGGLVQMKELRLRSAVWAMPSTNALAENTIGLFETIPNTGMLLSWFGLCREQLTVVGDPFSNGASRPA